MAKTYNSIPSVATGDVYTAAAHNAIATNVNNYRVPPIVRVTRATQTISNSSWTFIDTWVEAIDTDGMWTSANNYVEVQTAGVYLVTYGGDFAANSTNDRLGYIALNDATPGNGAIHQVSEKPIGLSTQTLNGSFIYSFSVSDKLRFGVLQNSGGNLAITTNFLALAWLGQVS